MSNMILNKISSKVKQSIYFSVMTDEIKDIKNWTIFCSGKVLSRKIKRTVFLGFTLLTDLDGESLSLHIKSILYKSKIYINNCIAQTWQGKCDAWTY